MSVEYLKKLLKVSGACDKLKKIPITEKAIITVLLRHYLPMIQQHQIDALFLNRRDYAEQVKKAKQSQFLSDNLEMGYGCLDDSDYQVMKAVISEQKKKLTEATEAIDRERRERPTMVDFVAPLRVNDISIGWTREWMPSKGILSKDTTLHWRWKLKYPNPAPPYVFSKVWGRRYRAF